MYTQLHARICPELREDFQQSDRTEISPNVLKGGREVDKDGHKVSKYGRTSGTTFGECNGAESVFGNRRFPDHRFAGPIVVCCEGLGICLARLIEAQQLLTENQGSRLRITL